MNLQWFVGSCDGVKVRKKYRDDEKKPFDLVDSNSSIGRELTTWLINIGALRLTLFLIDVF